MDDKQIAQLKGKLARQRKALDLHTGLVRQLREDRAMMLHDIRALKLRVKELEAKLTEISNTCNQCGMVGEHAPGCDGNRVF
jgi:septal ring factor EnvC (AmiA/AmiB activator)